MPANARSRTPADTVCAASGSPEDATTRTTQEDLHRAGIDRADALIAACDADSENLVVVLSARSTRSDLRIVSRVNEAAWHDRILHAGANLAQSPYPSYGLTLAAAAVSSAVLDLHDLPLLGLSTEEIQVPESSPLIGSTVSQVLLAHPYANVIGLRRDDKLHAWHAIEGVVSPGDVLVALGAPEYLATLAGAATPSNP